ncbi:hypothetical protein JM18_000377 [Phytophthora kernoviae]|uniref:G-patch domain-containing protein n=2 Tax=Phytophthora kernoviae TaxID=325452 RepID=A0A922ARW9_9STRA|nr:hypothetical protein G195_001400 [Phytophthora kernoviae 00238/432]KAG2531464.1 hypothetical protein JM18_000377 [Phytophthora kernoviae]
MRVQAKEIFEFTGASHFEFGHQLGARFRSKTQEHMQLNTKLQILLLPYAETPEGKKLMSRLGGMANESAAAEVSDFAKRQMEKMGWSKGKGLGKNEQGVKSHVKVKRREELQGVGAEKKEVQEQGNQWWYNVYDRMASKIVIDASDDEDKSKKKKKKSKKDKKRKREAAADGEKKYRVPTDEELFAATGGKLFGRRAYGSCNGKLKRDEMQMKKSKKEKDEDTPATTSSDSTDEETERKRVKKEKKKSNKKSKKEKSDDSV